MERGLLETTESQNNESGDQPQNRPSPDIPAAGKVNDQGDASVDPISDNEGSRKKRSPRGGFTVEYQEMGSNQDRAMYTADK